VEDFSTGSSKISLLYIPVDCSSSCPVCWKVAYPVDIGAGGVRGLIPVTKAVGTWSRPLNCI